jgi:hypothetical protein
MVREERLCLGVVFRHEYKGNGYKKMVGREEEVGGEETGTLRVEIKIAYLSRAISERPPWRVILDEISSMH